MSKTELINQVAMQIGNFPDGAQFSVSLLSVAFLVEGRSEVACNIVADNNLRDPNALSGAVYSAIFVGESAGVSFYGASMN